MREHCSNEGEGVGWSQFRHVLYPMQKVPSSFRMTAFQGKFRGDLRHTLLLITLVGERSLVELGGAVQRQE